MKIDKDLLFLAIPAAAAAGGTAWYAKKRGTSLPITVIAGVGGYFAAYHLINFIRRRFVGSPEQIPDAKMDALPSGQVPVATPTADAALGRVAEREKAVSDPNVKPTNKQEVGSNVVDLKPSESVNLDAFGSMGTV